MKQEGWKVVTVDIEQRFSPDVVADIRDYRYSGPLPDLIWASPPCTEFSRESMPWCRTGNTPDMSIVLACMRIIEEIRPRYWVIENVRGAIKYFLPILGQPRASFGPFFLWGLFPLRGSQSLTYKKKESFSSANSAARAKVPEKVSRAVMDSIRHRPMLFDYSAT